MPETTEPLPVHSPLGASSAERWMNCPGSVGLLKNLELPETDEPDYRANGIAAHEAAAACLEKTQDAWEVVGKVFHGVKVDTEIADAIQVYLDTVRALVRPESKLYIEARVSHPDHKLFYGTVDNAVVTGTHLDVTDYKHGEGIVVEVDDNPQVLYYAYGILRRHPEVETVTLRIVQPRGFHHLGPVREWETTAAYIRDWAAEELIPAMLRTEMDNTLDPGPWCRFCPAKLVCPMMVSLFGAACTADPKIVVQLSDAGVGRSYQYVQAVKFYLKALEDEAFRRLNLGTEIAGIKLVHKKANRVWKPGSFEFFQEHYGAQAVTVPEIKSPAEMAKIDGKAKELVKEWAYTPASGLTVALEDDPRVGVKVQSTVQAFGAAVAQIGEQSE